MHRAYLQCLWYCLQARLGINQREAQLRRQGSGEGQGLRALLQHGIYRERLTEMVTDAGRALLLDMAGYSTKVFEFVGGEHTSKNVMITAVRDGRRRTPEEVEALRGQLKALAGEFGLQSLKLAALMQEDLV